MKLFDLSFSFIKKKIADNGNNNNNNQTIRSPNQSLDKQSIAIPTSTLSAPTPSTSSTLTTSNTSTPTPISTSFSSNTSHQQKYNHNRNKNNKYNDKNKKYNDNNKYRKGNNNKYNNGSQYNNSKQHQHRQYQRHQQQHNHSHQRYQHHQQQQHNQQQKSYQTKKKSYQDPSFKPKEFPFDPSDSPCKLIDFVGGVNYTPSQDDGLIFNRVVKFFKNIVTTVEEENKLLDYNFYLRENQGFQVKIIQSNPTRYPPRKTLNCLSCDTESETNKNSKLPYPLTTREEISIHHNLWIDAKARSMFIITPKRHVERLSECNDQEIYSMFLLATQIIEQETRLSDAKWNDIRFNKMTLNHGNARNVEHLHLKISIGDKDFSHFKNYWNEERKKNFEKLKKGLYKRDERLAKIS